MRKYISLILGIALCGAGLWLLYDLIFLAASIRGLILMGAGFLAFVGAALVWDTLRRWNERG